MGSVSDEAASYSSSSYFDSFLDWDYSLGFPSVSASFFIFTFVVVENGLIDCLKSIISDAG